MDMDIIVHSLFSRLEQFRMINNILNKNQRIRINNILGMNKRRAHRSNKKERERAQNINPPFFHLMCFSTINSHFNVI
jgi:hypothetical protein